MILLEYFLTLYFIALKWNILEIIRRGRVRMSNKLESYRSEIVSLNHQILDLLSKRGELAQKIGEEKLKQGTRIYDPQREKEMLNDLIDSNKGPFNDNTIKQLF